MPTKAQYTSMDARNNNAASNSRKTNNSRTSATAGASATEGTQARTGRPATEVTTVITTSNAIAPAKVTAEWLEKKEVNQQQGQHQ
jgi:hypothetical protein